ncbi:Uma2 family endonuclease [Fibrella sp. WM1]|uniref:Uma2 family endonuclease n=1 Tax=Fibrella musci TaxID=3242485 RepID=UPI00351FE303
MTLSLENLPQEQLEGMNVKFGLDRMDDDAFYDFCRLNEELKLEQNPDGTIVVMPNTGGKTGNRNAALTYFIYGWTMQSGGIGFDSSTAFKLPNGATRSPDAAWISDDRWASLTDKQREKFPPLAPDFVVELMSASDQLPKAKEKMREYIDNGVQLGWLIDPVRQEVFIYRADGTISKHTDFEQPLTGETVLPGFAFDLRLLLR